LTEWGKVLEHTGEMSKEEGLIKDSEIGKAHMTPVIK
jgi:hypothetical protein